MEEIKIKCSTCQEMKPLDSFSPCLKNHWRHCKAYQCKPCRVDYQKRYQIENKEKLKERKRKYQIEKYKRLKRHCDLCNEFRGLPFSVKEVIPASIEKYSDGREKTTMIKESFKFCSQECHDEWITE